MVQLCVQNLNFFFFLTCNYVNLSLYVQWALGNYSQSFRIMISSGRESTTDKIAIPYSYAAFADPSIGQYCSLLASKTSMKNSVGEHTAGILSRWATWMTAGSLNRCGFSVSLIIIITWNFYITIKLWLKQNLLPY